MSPKAKPAADRNARVLATVDQLANREPVSLADAYITILHISDMHFGEQYRFVKPKRSLAALIEPALRDARIPNVDAIVMSGDFASEDTVNDLREFAFKQFEALRRVNNLNDFRRWLVVPGNHDVNWASETFTRAQRDTLRHQYLSRTHDYWQYVYLPVHHKIIPHLKKQKLADLLKVDDVTPGSVIRELMPSLCVFKFPSGRLVQMHGLNSSLVEGNEWSGIGLVGSEQMEFWRSVGERYGRTNAGPTPDLKLAVLHHHLKEVNPTIELPDQFTEVKERLRFSLVADSRSVLDGLIRAGYHLVLHGHQHHSFASQETLACHYEDKEWERAYVSQRLLIFGGGTVSCKGEPAGVENAFFVYRIHDSGELHGWVFSMSALSPGFTCVKEFDAALPFESTRSQTRYLVATRLQELESSDPGTVVKTGLIDERARLVAESVDVVLEGLGSLRTDPKGNLRLNLPDSPRSSEERQAVAANQPARFAKLLRRAVQEPSSHAIIDWRTIGPDLLERFPNVIDFMKSAALRSMSAGIPASATEFTNVEEYRLAVLNGYPVPETALLPDDIETRYFAACVVASRRDGTPHVLLHRHDYWKAFLFPVIGEEEPTVWGDPHMPPDGRLSEILSRWCDASCIAQCHLVADESQREVRKLQISPTKGVWTLYRFRVWFLKCASAFRGVFHGMPALSSNVTPRNDDAVFVSEHTLGLVNDQGWLFDDYKPASGPVAWKDPLRRGLLLNRELLQAVFDILKGEGAEKYFYDAD